MASPQDVREPYQLLVEGNDQRNFFEALRDKDGHSGIEIQDFGGTSELRGFLSAFVAVPGFGSVRRLGIVRDAEDSAMSAIQSVRGALENASIEAPSVPGVFTGARPAVGFLVLPDGKTPGMLETLICESFAGSAVDGCVDSFVDCVSGLDGVAMERPDKSRAFAFLATKAEPNVSVGVAAKKGYWTLGHHAFDGVRSFLRALAR